MSMMDNTHARSSGMHTPAAHPTLMQRLAVWRTRRALARLDARALADIGLTREAADREALKTVWDVPASWTQR